MIFWMVQRLIMSILQNKQGTWRSKAIKEVNILRRNMR